MRSLRRVFTVSALLMMAGGAFAADYLVYVGTYTGKQSRGIYAYRFNSSTGELKPLGLAAETPNPSWVTMHPTGDYLYAANETDRGMVTAFRVDKESGKLKQLSQVSSRGSGPCALAVDKTGKSVMVANYGSGTLALLPIKADGSVAEASATIAHKGSGANPQRQGEPHAHSANFSPDNRFALSCDLGLDKVFIYRFDPARGSLADNEPPFGAVPPGSGPRHFAFHPNGKFAYVINELTSTVTAFSWNAAAGALKPLETVPSLPAGYAGEKSGAEITVHPSGKYLYASNRAQASSVTVFAIDQVKGTLRTLEQVPTGGKEPRSFGIDPTGAFLLAANQNSNTIVVFRIDPKTGKLTSAGTKVEVGTPVCIQFAGR